MIDLLEYDVLGQGFDKNGLLAIQEQAEILAKKLAPGYLSLYEVNVDSIRLLACGYLVLISVMITESLQIYSLAQSSLLQPGQERIFLNMVDYRNLHVTLCILGMYSFS